jgi:hypothetical protein
VKAQAKRVIQKEKASVKGNSHRVVTEQVFEILASVDNQFPLAESKMTVVEASKGTDDLLDKAFELSR